MPSNGSENFNNLLKTTTIIMVPTNDVAFPYVAYVLYTNPSQFNAIRVKLYSFGSSPNAGPTAMKYITNKRITVARPWFSRFLINTLTHSTATTGLKKSIKQFGAFFTSDTLSVLSRWPFWVSRNCALRSALSKAGLSTPFGDNSISSFFSRFTSFNTKSM